jgi:signal transduction histidine kinase
MWRLRTQEQPSLPVDGTLRRIVVLFRLLGWGWMAILVVLTPATDAGANMVVAGGALALATTWTVATWWAAGASGELAQPWFAVADVVVALVVGAASTTAGAENLFHGGYLTSSLIVVAYAFDLRATIAASVLLTIEQVLVHEIDGRGVVPAVGSINFVVFAILIGWAFDRLREQERERIAVQAELATAVAEQARHEERLDIANRLHDSVLQTLAALRRDAADADQVRYLSRRQERQLRQTISEYRSPYANSARVQLQAICEEVEDLHRIEIDTVIRGDAECDQQLHAVLAATREALLNAAKHAGVSVVDLYAEFKPGKVQVYVRDRGRGFDPSLAATGSGMDYGLRRRLAEVGATVEVASTPGGGTDVAISWEAL